MSAKKPLVIVTRKLPDVIETRLMELFNTRLNLEDTPLSKSELAAAVASEVANKVALLPSRPRSRMVRAGVSAGARSDGAWSGSGVAEKEEKDDKEEEEKEEGEEEEEEGYSKLTQ